MSTTQRSPNGVMGADYSFTAKNGQSPGYVIAASFSLYSAANGNPALRSAVSGTPHLKDAVAGAANLKPV